LTSAGTIAVTDIGSVQASSFGAGDGGNISLSASEVDVLNGGSVEAGGFGTGLAGNIDINTTNQVVVHNGSISTEATTSDGGNITINTVALLDMLNSTVETQVQSGAGAGGNIDIDPAAVVLQNSGIIANAFGGPGGNISIVAGQFIATNSVVSASSPLGIDGEVEINAPDTNITGKLVPLPKNFLDASKLLRDRCGAARGGTSGFSAQGRGGVPPGPDGYLPSYATGDTDGHGSVTASAGNAAGSSGFRLETAGGPLLAMAATRCTW
ncbi:MAG: S-layer family protein, partial [Gammaproteobacteria bacterium]|nr:S-layer family protein [Gammaproteobacteria bacterium]